MAIDGADIPADAKAVLPEAELFLGFLIVLFLHDKKDYQNV